MNYINNAAIGCCCGCSNSDKIELSETTVLIDSETGKITDVFSGPVPGRTYFCQSRWVITKGFTICGTYMTREDAMEVYRKIVDELKKDDKVIDI